MTLSAKQNLLTAIALFTAFLLPMSTHANEYAWLKNSDFDNLFVYTRFGYCAVAEKPFTKIVNSVLLRSRIQPYVSTDPPIVWVTNEEGEVINGLRHKFVLNQKPFMHIITQCENYETRYIYDIRIRFAILNEKGNILLHEYPSHGAVGIDTISGIKTVFRTHLENAITDYLSANTRQ